MSFEICLTSKNRGKTVRAPKSADGKRTANSFTPNIKIEGIVLKYDERITSQFKGRDKVEWQAETDIIRTIPERKKFICKLAASRDGNTMILFKYESMAGSSIVY